ncbi:MAG: DUF5667 domain-containing protein [Patescibacteria group bacterium]|jgi:hypothetical protein
MTKALTFFLCLFLVLNFFVPIGSFAESDVNQSDDSASSEVAGNGNVNTDATGDPQGNPAINESTGEEILINELFDSGSVNEPVSGEKEKKKKEIIPASFGLVKGEPIVLPGNPLYFIKDAWRKVKIFFTFDQVKKQDLRLEQMNDRLSEVEELFNQPADPKSQQVIKKALDKYQKESEKVKAGLIKAKEELKKNDQVNELLSKNTSDELSREYILKKLEDKSGLQDSVKNEIRSVIDDSANWLATLVSLMQDPKAIEQSLTEAAGTGSVEQRAYNLDTLKQLEQKTVSSTKSIIEQVLEKSREQLKNELEKSDSVINDNLMNEFINSK